MGYILINKYIVLLKMSDAVCRKDKTVKKLLFVKKKNNKKGFTLVELVVVIAILAVLAAIAIPAVISIVNSASNTSLETEAASIDLACKTYYTSVKSGILTKENYTPVDTDDVIPSVAASAGKRLKLAKKCTVAGALEYNGTLGNFKGRLDEFAYDAEGNIYRPLDMDAAGITFLDPDGKNTFNDLHYAN